MLSDASDEKDRYSRIFLWVENLEDEKPVIKEYGFTRVIFGSGSSPYLLNTMLEWHPKNYEGQEPAVVLNVLPNMYYDDLCERSHQRYASQRVER